jgi:hypothetical protein
MPVVLGSIFDDGIESARLCNVKHMAMINWALREIQQLRTKSPSAKDEMLRTYLRAIQFVMKDCNSKVDPLADKELRDT